MRGSYVKNDKIFYCPGASNRPSDFKSWAQQGGQQDDPKAPDCGWLWNDGSTGSYGNNMALGGMDPATLNWGSNPPTEANVTQQSKVIYITDSRWVDLYGGNHPGRIGMARERHHNGAVCVCCDGHIKWITVDQANQWPQPVGAVPRWDYR